MTHTCEISDYCFKKFKGGNKSDEESLFARKRVEKLINYEFGELNRVRNALDAPLRQIKDILEIFQRKVISGVNLLSREKINLSTSCIIDF